MHEFEKKLFHFLEAAWWWCSKQVAKKYQNCKTWIYIGPQVQTFGEFPEFEVSSRLQALRSFSEATVCPKGLGCWPLVSTLSLLYWVYLSISYLCLFCFCGFFLEWAMNIGVTSNFYTCHQNLHVPIKWRAIDSERILSCAAHFATSKPSTAFCGTVCHLWDPQVQSERHFVNRQRSKYLHFQFTRIPMRTRPCSWLGHFFDKYVIVELPSRLPFWWAKF